MPTQDRPIVALGEVLWDVFPSGARFGGAPANFACHVRQLGNKAAMVSRVGQDQLGDDALTFLKEQEVDCRAVGRDATHSTGTVQVELDEHGKATYDIRQDVAWDHLAWVDILEKLAGQAQAVCFGSLAQRFAASRDTIQRFLRATNRDCLKVFDINLRPPFYEDATIRQSLEVANALKLNEEELTLVARLAGDDAVRGEQAISEVDWNQSDLLSPAHLRDLLHEIRQQFRLQWIALTCGEQGSIICTDDATHIQRAGKVKVNDTVGAGDSFTATVVVDWLHGAELARLHQHASAVSAFVCSQPGAVPPLPAELKTCG